MKVSWSWLSDYVAIEMGLEYISVTDPEETKKWIRGVLDANSLEKTGEK